MCPTVVLCVGLVEALRVDEAEPIHARVHRGRAVGLIWHQSVVPVTHQAVHLWAHRVQPDLCSLICCWLSAHTSSSKHLISKCLTFTTLFHFRPCIMNCVISWRYQRIEHKSCSVGTYDCTDSPVLHSAGRKPAETALTGLSGQSHLVEEAD